MKEFVLGFYFDADEGRKMVLLIQRLKPDWQFGLLNGLGGSVEGAELPVMAMVREFEEESGLTTKGTDWFEVATLANYKNDWLLHVFKGAGSTKGFKNACSEGSIDLFPLNELPRNMEQSARWLLLMCADDSLFGVVMKTSFWSKMF